MDERILDNKYIIHKMIGTGGMSIVYAGYSMDTGREVAIKVLRPEYIDDDEFVRRFRKESKIAQQLRHKNIITTMDTGEDEGLPYIVMEYIKGKTLKELIQERGHLSNEDAIDIAVKISDALYYAHSHKLIHRDIKPQNVMLKEDGTVKVTDFGIARMQDTATLTMGGSNVLGSVHYISPEQAKGVHITEKADIYSLGIVLYEMLTGIVPFEGDSPVGVAIKHLQEIAVPPRQKNPEISIALEDIILKMISKDPMLRYDDAFEISHDLMLALAHPEGGFVKTKVSSNDTLVNIPRITREMEMAATAARKEAQYQQGQSGSKKSYRRTRRRKSVTYSIIKLMISLVVIVGMVVTLFLIGKSLLSDDRILPMKEVPRVFGESDEKAQDIIRNEGFKVEISHEYHELVAEGVVIKQDPLPGQLLQEGSNVNITVSLGVQTIPVPDLVNRDYSEAIKLLEELGLKVGVVTPVISDAPNDYVIEQTPKANEEIPVGDLVDLKVAKAASDTVIKMPALLFLDETQAQNLILGLGFKIEQVIKINANEQIDTVIKQEPQEGEELIPDETKITLWVSNGAGAEYKKEYTIPLSVTEDNTHVVIEFIDDEKKVRHYDKTLEKGDYEITLNLKSDTWGEKELFVYFNGEQNFNDRIIFKVNDT